ncbi:MAG: hypothetical protein HW390_1906 [Candidatus Brocadiaceae bacterium]|nr:hypothetical protein [Candidatus Brocadiaceae bacterium]
MNIAPEGRSVCSNGMKHRKSSVGAACYNYAVACLAKITGRSYGAKYLGLRLMLQTGRPFGAKETVVFLHGILSFTSSSLGMRLCRKL